MSFFKILAIAFCIFFVIPYLLRRIVRFMYGNVSSNYNSSQQRNSARTQTEKQSSRKKKIIAQDEGEYVDYVEVKD